MRVLSYQHGVYPRSEAVVAATRGLERHRVDAAAVDSAYAADLADLIALQRSAGLDFFSDGLLRWQDIFRPFVDASPSMTAGGLVRWFDNNCFYRLPELTDESLQPDGAATLIDNAVPAPRVLTVPSPYMFSRVVHGVADHDSLMHAIARDVLNPALRHHAGDGPLLVHVEEPWLAYRGIDAASWPAFERSLTALRDGVDATFVLHVYFGDAAPHLDRLQTMPVDAIGVDLVETDIGALRSRWRLGLAAGCLDGRRSTLEERDATVELVRELAGRVEPPALYLTSSCELELLPRPVADAKVARLAEVGRAVAETLS